MRIGIVITNPNHHLDLTLDVASALKELGHEPFYLSLCEMRRMKSPVEKLEKAGIPFYRQKELPGDVKPSSGAKTLGANDSFVRTMIRELFWQLKLKTFVRKHLTKADKVWILNDTAFPGDKIAAKLTRLGIPFYLMQEGIRFPLPGEAKSSYGANGAKKVMVWGKRSAEYFESVVKKGSEVVVTGSPRFEDFTRRAKSLKMIKGHGKILGVFTNPIDDQGFCTKDEKLELFENFIKRGAGQLNQPGLTLGLKCHPREDVSEYLEIARKYVIAVTELPKDILEAIHMVAGGVIFASTVGLELLLLNKRLAQLQLPGHGYVFDYEENPDLLKIPVSGNFDLSVLLQQTNENSYIYSHVYQEKSPVDLICKAILE